MSRGRAPQFAIYNALLNRKIDVRVEVRLLAVSLNSRSGWFYADLAVYDRRGKLAGLCECKSLSRRLTGRQLENYEGARVPYIVAGNDNVEVAVKWLGEKAEGTE